MRRHWEDTLQELARKDPEFRQALKDDPKKAIESKIGVPLPDFINVKVVEETPDTAYVVLPMDASGEAEAIRTEKAYVQSKNIAQSSGGSWSTCGKELTCWCVTTAVCGSSASTVHGSC